MYLVLFDLSPSFGIVVIAVNFLGTPGKHPYYLETSGFGLGSFVFGFLCFCSQRALFKNSRADIATHLLCDFCHRACRPNTRADLVFKGSARYPCPSALTSRSLFFVIFVIASVCLITVLTSFALGQRAYSLSFRADSAKLLKASSDQRQVAEDHPR